MRRADVDQCDVQLVVDTVLYTSAHDLLRSLHAARADGSHDRKLLRYISPDLLLVDDLRLRSLEHDEPIDLYEIIRRRHEQGWMIITSNRAVEEWPPVFRDALLASAVMDRLRHHAHVIEIDDDSTATRRWDPATSGGPADLAFPLPNPTRSPNPSLDTRPAVRCSRL